MAYSELYKINSDIANEPLNFNNYINDISTFKDKSYVLDKNNEGLWMDLMCHSLTVYGHQAIHDVVYERLTDAEVDTIIESHGRLGQALNSFHNVVGVYRDGNIDSILTTILSDPFNSLQYKFRTGIVRYLNKKTDGEDACAWLATLFPEVEGLSDHTTLQSLLEDTEYFNSIFFERKMEYIDGEYKIVEKELNLSLRYLICNGFAGKAFSDTMAPEVFQTFTRECAKSTVTSLALIENIVLQEKQTEFFADEIISDIIAGNKEAIWGIAANTTAFEAFIDSPALQKCAEDGERFQAIVDGFIKANELSTIVNRMEEHCSSLASDVASITEEQDVIDATIEMKEVVGNAKEKLDRVVKLVRCFVDNMLGAWENADFVKATIGSNQAAVDQINSVPDDIFEAIKTKIEKTFPQINASPSSDLGKLTGHVVLIGFINLSSNPSGSSCGIHLRYPNRDYVFDSNARGTSFGKKLFWNFNHSITGTFSSFSGSMNYHIIK